MPDGSTRPIRLFPVSAMQMEPSGPIASPVGIDNSAALASPPSPLNPLPVWSTWNSSARRPPAGLKSRSDADALASKERRSARRRSGTPTRGRRAGRGAGRTQRTGPVSQERPPPASNRALLAAAGHIGSTDLRIPAPEPRHAQAGPLRVKSAGLEGSRSYPLTEPLPRAVLFNNRIPVILGRYLSSGRSRHPKRFGRRNHKDGGPCARRFESSLNPGAS
jgi:hypothetical protein